MNTLEDMQELYEKQQGFNGDQLRRIQAGLQQMFDKLGVRVTMSIVNTSKKSSSLYIRFNDHEVSTVRISTHKPVHSQQHFINIF